MRTGIWRLFAGGLIGKVLGVVRETLLAYLFGTSQVAAANRVAQTAVLSPLNLVTTDALSGAFLPIEARLLKANPASAIALYRSARALFLLLGLVLLPVFWIFDQSWITFIAPGSSAHVVDLAATMLVTIAIGMPSYLHYNMLAYLDMAHGGYRLSSLRATGQSIGLIAGTLLAYALHRPTLLAAGFSGAYVIMSASGMWYVRRKGYLHPSEDSEHTPGAGFDWHILRPFARRLGILIWLPILNEAMIVSEKMTLSHRGYQSLAAVDYARLVTDTGILLIATPVGLASLPTFAICAVADVRPRLLSALQPFIVIGLACSSSVWLFARPVVQILYGHGAFDGRAVTITSQMLEGMGIGLWAQLINYFLIKVMNARDNNRISISVVAVATIVTVSTRPTLVDWFGDQGVGYAISLGAVVAFIFACVVLRVLGTALRTVGLCLPALAVTGALHFLARNASIRVAACYFLLVVVAWLLNVAVSPLRFTLLRSMARSPDARAGRHRPDDDRDALVAISKATGPDSPNSARADELESS